MLLLLRYKGPTCRYITRRGEDDEDKGQEKQGEGAAAISSSSFDGWSSHRDDERCVGDSLVSGYRCFVLLLEMDDFFF